MVPPKKEPEEAPSPRRGLFSLINVARENGIGRRRINGPSGPMKLHMLYAPPNYRDGVVHATKAEAEADKEHFGGKTTEAIRPTNGRTVRELCCWRRDGEADDSFFWRLVRKLRLLLAVAP